jgi:hypothetical protein
MLSILAELAGYPSWKGFVMVFPYRDIIVKNQVDVSSLLMMPY